MRVTAIVKRRPVRIWKRREEKTVSPEYLRRILEVNQLNLAHSFAWVAEMVGV